MRRAEAVKARAVRDASHFLILKFLFNCLKPLLLTLTHYMNLHGRTVILSVSFSGILPFVIT